MRICSGIHAGLLASLRKVDETTTKSRHTVPSKCSAAVRSSAMMVVVPSSALFAREMTDGKGCSSTPNAIAYKQIPDVKCRLFVHLRFGCRFFEFSQTCRLYLSSVVNDKVKVI